MNSFCLHRSGFDAFTNAASRVKRRKVMHLWRRIENLFSLYFCAHERFCKRCPIAEYEVSSGLLFETSYTSGRKALVNWLFY